MANEFKVRKALDVTGPATISGNASVGGDLSVAGSIQGDQQLVGSLDISNDLHVTDDADIDGDLNVDGNTVVDGDLTVNGSFSFAGGSVFADNTFEVQDNVDPTKAVKFDVGSSATGTTTTLSVAQTANRILQLPDANTSLVGTDTTQSLSNKKLISGSVSVADTADTTKLMQWDVSAITPAMTRTIIVPDANVDLGALTNSNIATGAAIARTKLASGTASHVIVNDGSGVLSSEATLAASRGGLATDASAFSGLVKAIAGVFSASSLVNADVAAGAAIARSKLASGTANHVIINDGAGVMSSETSLDETRGGTAQTTFATGDTLYASAADTLSKRAIGTAGQVLKTGDAGIPVWEDTNYPTQETRIFEDWHTDAVGIHRWLDADTGTGVSATGLTVADTNHAGILELNTGASATGAAIRYLGGVTTGSATAGFALGGGVLTFEWLARVEDLSTAGERYSLMLGLFDTATTQVNSVRFLYNDSVNAGNWTISAINASTVTNTDSGVAVAADTWYKLRAVVNAAATSIEFFINGVSVGTVTTNIPTASIAPRASMAKTVGTAARQAYTDYFRLYQRLTSAR